MSKTHVLRSNVLLARWRERRPTVGELRPDFCLGCERVHGRESYVLRGHGLQQRTALGPLGPDASARLECMECRRYFCPACTHVTVVVPLEHSGVFRYAMTAIVASFAMWSIGRQTAGAVRERMAASKAAGFGDPWLWSSLRRWVRERHRLWPNLHVRERATARETAAAIVAALCAKMSRAPPVPTVAAAWEAALAR